MDEEAPCTLCLAITFLLLLVTSIAIFPISVICWYNHVRFLSISVSSATVSPLNISSPSSQLTATWNISLSFTNPYIRIGLDYNLIDASIFYGPHLLSRAAIPAFHVPQRKKMNVDVGVVALSDPVDRSAAESMVEDRARLGAVEFGLEMMAFVRYHEASGQKRAEVLRVYCEKMVFGFQPSDDGLIVPGALLGPQQKCRIRGGRFSFS